MEKKTKTDQSPDNSPGKKRPLDPREYPLARDARGAARHEEIRAKTSMVSAPRQSNRPVVRSSRNQTHGR